MILLLACVEAEPEATFGSPAEAADEDSADGAVAFSLEALGGTAAAKSGTHDDTAAATSGYSYNGQVPGPTLRARLGDSVVVRLHNELPVATSIHWHGLSVPEAEDGDAGELVEPGGSTTFSFTVEQAGTFWYHAASSPTAQVEAGLYGAFIVEDPADPTFDRELVVLWQSGGGSDASRNSSEDADVHDGTEDTGHTDAVASAKSGDHDHTAHAVTDPADIVWTANGQTLPTYTWQDGKRVRVRMINTSGIGYLDLRDAGVRIGGDQGMLAGPDDPDAAVLLAPGDRGDFEWATGGFTVATGLYGAAGGAALGDPVPLLIADGGGASVRTLETSGALPSADPGTTDAVLVLSGGGDETWLVNGESWPDVTPVALSLGTHILEVRNLSSAEHALHLRGAPFEVLSIDDTPPAWRQMEDTLNLPSLAKVRLLIQFSEPGDWTFQCQAHLHDEGGMKTVIHVE